MESTPQAAGAEPVLVSDAPRKAVFVTGAGRSGTSTVSGALNLLGLQIPPPVVSWNKSNPRGFFEPRWVVDFHERMLASAKVHDFDADPGALSRARETLTAEVHSELREWYADAVRGASQLVIKDPRTVWALEHWIRASGEVGTTPACLTMLRHPTEVVGSRSTYYAGNTSPEWARHYAVSKLAGWVNVNLINEELSRGQNRVFVNYGDLLEDWRPTMAAVRDALGLVLNADPESGAPHPVDEFVDSGLRRVRITWDDLDVPTSLREIAEEVWTACQKLAAAGGGDDPAAQEDLDAIRVRYQALHGDATAIAHDASVAAVRQKADETARGTRSEMRQKLAKARSRAKEAEARANRAEAATAQPAVSRAVRRVLRRLRRR